MCFNLFFWKMIIQILLNNELKVFAILKWVYIF